MTGPGRQYSFAGSAPLSPWSLPRNSKAALEPRQLDDFLVALSGVGPATARAASKLGIDTLRDLIFHFPSRHEDFTSSRQLAELRHDEEATVTCVLENVSLRPTRRRHLRLVNAMVRDESGFAQAVWFNQDYLAETLKSGDRLLLRGRYNGSSNSIVVKSHEVAGADEAGVHTTGFVPVYPATEKVAVRKLRGWLARVKPLAARLADPLPTFLRVELKLPSRADAVLAMHFPRDLKAYSQAQRRLIFEELYLMQVGLLARRQQAGGRHKGIALGAAGALAASYVEQLPFRLTPDQERVMAEIAADLARDEPMQRLLQGDVGSGKTVVAVYTLLKAVENGHQAALMAPTEVLAEQHFLGLQKALAGLGVEAALLSSRLKAAERRRLLERIAAGEVQIAVGTHALIQRDVRFASLACAVVDEQHRFGVRQRQELVKKASGRGAAPHTLHMTATPIPRTMSLTLYGDLDVSVIRSLPAGRQEVVTRWATADKRPLAYKFIRGQLDKGRQCYVVCPLIEESDALEAKAVAAEAGRLAEGPLAGYRIGSLHGQMGTDERRQAMQSFAAGETQVLVATTVIEVGVDVPNASVMLIEEADRFGLAQLHQLRGRVGRGEHRSFCILFGDPSTEQGQRRLKAMTESSDGFVLADIDLEIRGEGQLFGTRQSGLPDLRMARLTRDGELLGLARQKARELLEADPGLKEPAHALLRDEIERAFGGSLDLKM